MAFCDSNLASWSPRSNYFCHSLPRIIPFAVYGAAFNEWRSMAISMIK